MTSSSASAPSSSAAVDSGVDSEGIADGPSSPDSRNEEEEENETDDDDAILETAETLLALSGKTRTNVEQKEQNKGERNET